MPYSLLGDGTTVNLPFGLGNITDGLQESSVNSVNEIKRIDSLMPPDGGEKMAQFFELFYRREEILVKRL